MPEPYKSVRRVMLALAAITIVLSVMFATALYAAR